MSVLTVLRFPLFCVASATDWHRQIFRGDHALDILAKPVFKVLSLPCKNPKVGHWKQGGYWYLCIIVYRCVLCIRDIRVC